MLVAGFVLLFQNGKLARMSLTSYAMQSMVGSFIYYGYGPGLYKVTGASTGAPRGGNYSTLAN